MTEKTFSGGTSFASSSECRGFAPPFPPIKMLKPFSVEIKPKLVMVSIFHCRSVIFFQNSLLILCFSTFPHASRHGTLELVR